MLGLPQNLLGITANNTDPEVIQALQGYGDQAISQFNEEFPGVQSPSRINARIYGVISTQYEAKTPTLLGRKDKVARMSSDIYGITAKMHEKLTEEVYPACTTQDLRVAVQDARVANCRQMAEITDNNLESICPQDINHFQSRVEVVEKKTGKVSTTREYLGVGNHQFNVVTDSKNPKPNKKGSWGANAVITDPWGGFSAPVERGLSEISAILKVDPETERLKFCEPYTFENDIWVD